MKSLKTILTILRDFKNADGAEYGIERLGVFGSYARGEQNADSDIDICIKIKRGGLLLFGTIKTELEDSLQSKIGLVSLGAIMHPLFKQSLDRDAIYI